MRWQDLSRRLAHTVKEEREDTTERVEALRLQAEAWRLLALIALTKPDYAARGARWLFFRTLPFVDAASVRGFVEEHREMARACGTEAGVFGGPTNTVDRDGEALRSRAWRADHH